MIRLHRASVIAAFILLAWTVTAHAECAWLVWARLGTMYESTEGTAEDGSPKGRLVPTRRNVVPPGQWIEQAHTTSQDCFRAADKLKPAPPPPGGDSKLYKVFTTDDGARLWAVATFICLPDTVDPRGPKGN